MPALLIPALSYAAAWSVFRLLYLARWHRELRAAGLRQGEWRTWRAG